MNLKNQIKINKLIGLLYEHFPLNRKDAYRNYLNAATEIIDLMEE